MGPVGHAGISSAVGIGVGAATGSVEAGALTLGVGVLMDVDHMYDFFQWYVRSKPEKFYVLLHAWEYSIVGIGLLASVFYHPLALAVLVAHLSHVITDQLHNGLHPLGYSIIFRVVKKFDAGAIAPDHDPATAYWQLLGVVPGGKRLAPWFQQRVGRWYAVPAAEDEPPEATSVEKQPLA